MNAILQVPLMSPERAGPGLIQAVVNLLTGKNSSQLSHVGLRKAIKVKFRRIECIMHQAVDHRQRY